VGVIHTTYHLIIYYIIPLYNINKIKSLRFRVYIFLIYTRKYNDFILSGPKGGSRSKATHSPPPLDLAPPSLAVRHTSAATNPRVSIIAEHFAARAAASCTVYHIGSL
jgi:hypothetical protein